MKKTPKAVKELVEPKSEIRLVLAGSYEQFKHYFPYPDRHTKYISDRTQLYGYRNVQFLRVGTWWEQKQELIDAFEQFEHEDYICKQATPLKKKVKV